jgi:hypothetical protein
VKRVYQSTTIPWQLHVRDGKVLWSDGLAVTAIDPASGHAVPAPPTSEAPTPGFTQRYPSPDGRWVAELGYPDGSPEPSTTGEN